RAQRLARQQMEFVAGVTHELHTPLTAIRSAGQNLADGVVADPQQVKRYGALVEREGRRLSDMVAQALELAGIQSGRRVYHPRPEEVTLLLDGALEDCRPLIKESRTTVTVAIPAGLPPVLADGEALRRALRNLIENAARYGGPTPAEVEIHGLPAANPRAPPTVQVAVCDRGPGVPEAERERIFEPFYRLPGHAEQAGGVGLGLSLVRQIAQRHRGRVHVEPRDGGGSRFVITLPGL
ncbi:MAG: HAMP domain-containing sensor histidine kinase, partial [Acidobacteriota bacterium]